MNLLKRINWQFVLTVLVVCTIVPLASVALVRNHNRDRAMTSAIAAALTALKAVPDSRLSPSLEAGNWRFELDKLGERIVSGEMPVDSARAFYHEYAFAARDGIIDSNEVRRLALWIGMKVLSENIESMADTTQTDRTP